MVTSTSIIGPKKAEIMDVWTVEGANSTGHPNGILHALCSSETLSHKIRDQILSSGNGIVLVERRQAVCIKPTQNENIKPVMILIDRTHHLPVSLDTNLTQQKEELRKQAMDKLSPEEQRALGL